jgi:hypothetical protein
MILSLTPPYETGPYRPPNEAKSLLIRVTRNCKWNRCAFCPLYKGESYEERPVEEILKDVDAAAVFYQAIGIIPETAFLQDAEPLALKTPDLVRVLQRIRERFPDIQRITAYARSATLANKPVDEWREIHEAGLTRIHRGLETGYDSLLRYMEKGATARTHIIGGQRIKQAGIELSDYVMPGLGGNLELEPGKPTWEQHAKETALVLNEVNPDYIRLRTLVIPPDAPLAKKEAEEGYRRLSDPDIIREIRLFLETLEVTGTELDSGHIINVLREVGGRLPQDKKKMIATLDRYLTMSPEDQIFFRLGVLLGYFHSDMPKFHTLDQFYAFGLFRTVKQKSSLVLQKMGIGSEECIDELLRRAV